MLHKKTALLRAAAPVAVLALALTACGGNKKSTATDDAPKTKTEKGSSAPADSGELKAGQGGTGKFKEDSGTITYEVAAQKVHVSTEAETKKLVSDPKRAKGLVTATAWVKYTNKGGGVVKESPDVADESEIYADGQRGGLLIGAAEDGPGCEDTLDIENWKAGQSHTICQTYMIPKGAKSVEVHWAGEGQSGSPLIWKFDNAG
ncbi:hypothetical protein QT196_24410 [Streptomyces sp. P9-2B-2]|uniref:hypothetical protein n=1 Tax=unclassified Streptomyces TaxID=2593676 RepID=UPI001B3C7ABC|nr:MULTISPECIES: hypothetical protein [unclassified Streptomyces]WJY40164.1 hypothetical protein QT196_24410 [Streptomyces sp. P9-2B-2]